MPPSETDILIFGGGLAGSMLAETLIRHGRRVLLVDDPSKSHCSRVAAGLINPIGGKRLNLVWKAKELIPFAHRYYIDLETQLEETFFHPIPIARLFASESEKAIWAKRSPNPEYASRTLPLDLSGSLAGLSIKDPSGFTIPQGAYLDTHALLDAIHKKLRAQNVLLNESFAYKDIQISPEGVHWNNIQAQRCVFAEGHLATENPWFNFAPFKPAKGVIGRIETDLPLGNTAIIREKFIIPGRDGTATVGATYNWSDASDAPDPEGISQLERFLNSVLGPNNWKWRDVRAGVRPATAGAKPIIGPHPTDPRVLAFNGFGSKGAMQIPYFAEQIAFFLTGEQPLDPDVLPSRFIKKKNANPIRWQATEIARDEILKSLLPGALAIDATAGNGFDSLWLAQAVGETGHVHSFDIQEQAIVSTQARLQAANLLDRVSLHRTSHQNLTKSIPAIQHGQFSAIVFNLGYLPRSDSPLVTQPVSTLAALSQSLQLLRPGGQLSVVVYPGHDGGKEEACRVIDWASELEPRHYEVRISLHPKGLGNSPYPIFVRKL